MASPKKKKAAPEPQKKAEEASPLKGPAEEKPKAAEAPAAEMDAQAAQKKGSALKTAAVVILLVIAIALAYYFINQSSSAFSPGASVDAETFKGIFSQASNIFIVMDVRGVKDQKVSDDILQCGVDFAGSSGMGGKTVTPLSLADSGCTAPDGNRDPQECFSMLRNGLTIYVKQGPGGASFYSNGMVVTVGSNYTLGSCSIKSG